jgi:hypothetical protein
VFGRARNVPKEEDESVEPLLHRAFTLMLCKRSA